MNNMKLWLVTEDRDRYVVRAVDETGAMIAAKISFGARGIAVNKVTVEHLDPNDPHLPIEEGDIVLSSLYFEMEEDRED